MKLWLGGGWDADGGDLALDNMKRVIEEIFAKEKVQKILHIPFARTGIMKKNRVNMLPEIFGEYIENLGIEYFTAKYIEDLEKFNGDIIYINGGNNTNFLFECCQNPILKRHIDQAKVIIGESAGAMIWGEYFWDNIGKKWVKGFGKVEKYIIEPHFSQRNKGSRLEDGMEKFAVKFGLGIDETTFVEYEDGEFGERVGVGEVFYNLGKM